MLTETRRNKIIDLLKEKEQLTTQALVDRFDVTGATIRNDLKALEKKGLLKRIHGGAVASQKLVIPANYTNFRRRSQKNAEEKKALAAEAIKFIAERQTIITDASSTVLHMAPLLAKKEKLTVITNGLFTALTIKNYPTDISVILVGGALRKNSGAIEGRLGENVLSQINSDIMLTSAHGLTLEEGLTEFNLHEVELKKKMLSRARKVIALIDHSKIGYTSTTSYTELENIDILITDSRTPDKIIKEIKNRGVEVIVCET